MATRGSKNNVLAGLFLLVSLVLAVAVVIVLANLDDRLTPREEYIVRFPLHIGAEGLTRGSIVKVGGQPVGRVTGWEFATADGGDASEPTAIDVLVSVRSDLRLYEDAIAFLEIPLLGSGSTINIPHIGDGSRIAGAPQGSGPVLEPGEVLRGDLAVPAFLAQAGYGDEQAEQVRSIIRNMSATTERVDRLTARFETELEPALEEVRGILDDVRAVTGDARAAWPEWRGRVDSTLARVDDAAAKIGPVIDNAHAGMDEARAVVGDVRSMVADNREKVDAALTNVQDLTEKARGEGWEMVRGILDRGQQGVDHAADVAERVRTFVRQEIPQLGEVIANARLASDQLRLTTTEVRAAPWKLLARPTGRRELENEVLYDAARQYAVAVSDLRATANALEALAATPSETTPSDDARIRGLVDELQQAFERYQSAEQSFLDRLVQPTGGETPGARSRDSSRQRR